tara:strand:+ start:163 stop:480 length:318 start_codon:yes stop_codon:yes gene_type:complete
MPEESKLAEKLEEKQSETKFSEEEMKSIKELQSTYVALQNSLGQIGISRIRLQQQEEAYDKAEENIRKGFSEAQEKEKEFVKSINEKYGDGNLDINTGIFTPKSS